MQTTTFQWTIEGKNHGNRFRDWDWVTLERMKLQTPFLSNAARPRFLRFCLQQTLVISQFLIKWLFLKYLDKMSFRKRGKSTVIVSNCCGRRDRVGDQLIWNYRQLITIMSPHQLLSAAHAPCDTHRACALLYGQWSWGQSQQDKARQ